MPTKSGKLPGNSTTSDVQRAATAELALFMMERIKKQKEVQCNNGTKMLKCVDKQENDTASQLTYSLVVTKVNQKVRVAG